MGRSESQQGGDGNLNWWAVVIKSGLVSWTEIGWEVLLRGCQMGT